MFLELCKPSEEEPFADAGIFLYYPMCAVLEFAKKNLSMKFFSTGTQALRGRIPGQKHMEAAVD